VNDIRIETVETKKALKKFIKFPWKVYQNDANWVPPLIMEVKDKLDRKRNPFFEHAEMSLFLAYKEGHIAGRIAAIIDANHNSRHKEKIVFFGMFECFDDSDVSKALLNSATAWGRERGMNVLRGPVNLSLNDECALLIEGFDSPPSIMMPYNPPYYMDLLERYGLSKARDLYAFQMKKGYIAKGKIRSVIDRIKDKTSLTLREVDLKHIIRETQSIAYIYNEAWKHNWGFVPWTQPEMDHTAKNLKQFADPHLILFAEDKGRPVGFAFALPNYNEIFKKMKGKLFPFGILIFLLQRKKVKGMRVLVFGILDQYRNTGISYLLYKRLEENAIREGYQWCETSWQLEDNEAVNRFTESLGGKIYKKYRIYEKTITEQPL